MFTAGRVVPALDVAEQGVFASALDWKLRRSRSSHSSVAKKLSAMALSYASPTHPIDGRTPISSHRWPKVRLVYGAHSIDRCNTFSSRGCNGNSRTWSLQAVARIALFAHRVFAGAHRVAQRPRPPRRARAPRRVRRHAPGAPASRRRAGRSDAVTRALGDRRGRHDAAAVAQRAEVALQHEAARPGFV